MIDKQRIEKAVKEILMAVGENPEREGLKETPKRVAEMYTELFAGLQKTAADEIKVFEQEFYDEMVVVKDIPVYSVCEHHLLPFFGTAHVAYIPSQGKILGLSKITRIVDNLAKKPQLQERLCNEAADAIMNFAGAVGAFVIMEAEHLCMTMRGIKKPGAKAVTVAARGTLKTDEKLRKEALTLLK